MAADTLVAGYPACAVATFRRGQGPDGKWIAWTAQCGAVGIEKGAFERAGQARRGELCRGCFPGRKHNACKLDKPVDLTDK